MPTPSSKVVAITGASAGIGKACALRLARDGAAVVVAARRTALLNEVAQAITTQGGRALAVEADVTSPADMSRLVQRSVETFGQLDVMICNAGIGFHGGLGDSTPEMARRLFDVNVLGTIYAAIAAHQHFRVRQAGHIIAMSSIAGVRGGAGMSVYSATKAAQIAFIESLRVEFLGTGMHASVVLPPSIPTGFREVMRRDYGHAADGAGPRQTANDVAEAVARCIEQPSAEVYPYRKARWYRLGAALAPGLADRLMKRYDRREK